MEFNKDKVKKIVFNILKSGFQVSSFLTKNNFSNVSFDDSTFSVKGTMCLIEGETLGSEELKYSVFTLIESWFILYNIPSIKDVDTFTIWLFNKKLNLKFTVNNLQTKFTVKIS